MTHERDERWAYIVLGLLVVAYVVYRAASTDWLSGLSLDLSSFKPRGLNLGALKLGAVGRTLPYLAAPLIAVLSEVFRRRRARAVKTMWETKARAEGFLRDEEDLKVRFVQGGRGTMQSDVRLTRAAIYFLDRAGRREPMRFGISRDPGTGYALKDVRFIPGKAAERPAVRIVISGESAIELEFASANAGGWVADIRRVLGRSPEPPPEEAPEEQTEE